jgi:hypothetical protein
MTATACAVLIFSIQLTTPKHRMLGREPAFNNRRCFRTQRSQGAHRNPVASAGYEAAADTHVADTEDRKSERVLEKASQRCFMIVAVDADDAH